MPGRSTDEEGSYLHPEVSWPVLSVQGQEDDPNELFELHHILGQGSYGTVYKASVRNTDQLVAIKILPLGQHNEQATIQKEIDMLKECEHPNIVRYMGSWRATDSLWIVMEYCGGGSVTDLIHAADMPIDEDIIAYICREILAGLAYLHSIGKVHRDIKCGNVLLTESGQVKLADFGVAAQLTTTMSKRKTYIGTPHWMAPEVIAESSYDGKVDVWATGISAIEMAEAQPPRWKVHPMRVIFLIGREPPPQLADRDHWSLPCHDFVGQCLQKEPKVRPSAKYLQQHKFVAVARPGAQASLVPLIARSQELLLQAAAAEQAAQTSRDGGTMATGHFSWREPPGPGGTVLAGAALGQGTSPARGPWAKTGMVRARLEGLSFGSPVPSPSAPAAEPNWGGTVLVDGTPASSISGTVVVGQSLRPGDSIMRRGSEGLPGGFAGGTMVEQRGSTDGADYLAALGAAASHDRGCLAAVSAAAKTADAAHVHDGGPLPRGPAAPPARSDRERLLERLRAAYTSGAVVPLPFLPAASAAPAALLADLRTPYADVDADTPALGFGHSRTLAKGAWMEALIALAADGTAGQGADAKEPGSLDQLPAAALQQVADSPTLQNLARALAYHQRCADEEFLSRQAAEQSQALADALSDTLRTILCL